MLNAGPSFSAKHLMIDTLGTSKKGQFVAIEEYGHDFQKHSYYVRIRIINVWQNTDVVSPIFVEFPAQRPYLLERAREKARLLSQGYLTKYDISR